MLISTVIFMDGEERQFLARNLFYDVPEKNLIRVDLGKKGEIVIPLTAIKEIHTEDLPADAISPEVLNGEPKIFNR